MPPLVLATMAGPRRGKAPATAAAPAITDETAPTTSPPRTPAPAWQASLLPPPPELSGRFPITDVSPASLGGRRPAAAAVGEAIPVRATAFREGHDSMGMTVRLHRPDGSLAESVRMAPEGVGMDGWLAHVRPTDVGDWSFTLEAWSSPWDTWVHRATIKIPAGVDVELEFAEGALLLERAAALLPADVDATTLTTAASTLVATGASGACPPRGRHRSQCRVPDAPPSRSARASPRAGRGPCACSDAGRSSVPGTSSSRAARARPSTRRAPAPSAPR